MGLKDLKLKLKKTLEELGNKPVTNPGLVKFGQFAEKTLKSPVGRIGQSFLQGGTSGNSFGLVNPEVIKPQNAPEKVAQSVGWAMGAFNPKSLGMRALGGLGNLGTKLTTRAVSQIAPKATGFVAKKLLPVIGSEVAQTAGFGTAKVGLGQQFNPVTDLAFGLGIRGLAPGAGSAMKLFGGAKEIDLNLKEIDQLRDAWRTAKKADKPKLLELIRNSAERNLSPEIRDRYSSNPAMLIKKIQENLTSKKPQVYPTINRLVGDIKPSSRKGSYTNPQGVDLQKGKQLSNKPLVSETPTRTTASSEVSLNPSIANKGKLNIGKLKIKGVGKKELENIESKVQPTIIGNKEVVQMAKTAKGTGTMTDEQMKKLMAQQLKNRQMVVDLAKRYSEAKKSGASEIELGKLMLEMANQSRTARQGGTFAGRLLQAQNIVADQSASPMQKILALLDNAGVSEDKYLKDAVKVNWDSPAQVVSFYRKYVPPKFGEVLDEIRYSNMLSSPLTHITNIASNAIQTATVAPIEKTITGALDWGKSALTGGERKYYASAGIDYAGGYVKALPAAIKKAWKVLSGQDVSVRPDYENIPTGSTGVLKAYTLPLRALESMDQFFRTLVEGGVTNELKNAPQKLSGIKIAGMASKEADYRLFRQAFDPTGELGQGAVLKYFDMWNSAIANLRRLPGGKWILPFLQTPTNILKQGVEYSPLGITTAIGAKNPTEQISKALIGTSVFMGTYQLAKNGLTSWEAPTGEKERELYYAAGMQPYSVKIGDKWVSFSKLGPLSYPMAMAAALANAERYNPDQTTMENIGKSISGMLGFFGDQSYVRSIGDLVDAIQGGVNIGSSALSAEGANLAGQLIPYKSFLTWLGRMTDPVYRKASTFTERLTKDLPIVGKNLEPYTDINGNPSKRDFPFINSVSPYKVTQEKGQEAELLNQYQDKKIEKAVEKRADEEFLKGNKEQQTGNVFRYIDENGSVKKIDLSFPMPEYKPTGNETLDKEKLADYRGAITKAKNDIMQALEVGAITEDEAVEHLQKLEEASNKTKKGKKVSAGSPVKIRGIQIKAPSKMPIVKFSSSSSPRLKFTSTQRREIPRIKLKQLSSPKLKIKSSYYNS